MTEVTMPRLSDSMEEGTILRWLKRDGESVQAGEDLVEIETDKATVTHAAETGGTLQTVAAEGSTVPVGEVIARVGETAAADDGETAAGDDGETAAGDDGETAAGDDEETAAREQEEAVPAAGDVPTPPPASNGGGPATEEVAVSGDSPLATPLAKRVARTHGVELDRLSGTGPRGRITRGDVLTAAGITTSQPRTEPATAPDDAETQEPSRVQQLIARRMSQSRATIPDFEVETEAVMDQVLQMRASLKETADDEQDVIPSINDFVVKACAIALRQHPRVNGSYVDGRFKLHRRVNIGIAVATDDALVVPTVFDADSKSLGTIAREAQKLAARVRSGEITPSELSGGTFTVSNLGMFGMSRIRPVINLPQAAILGVGAIRETLARGDGQIIDRRLMTLTVSADHRILYGADAARFLADVRALLESPLKLAL